MSDNTTPTDRILSHLRDRLETLDAEIRERQSRRDDLLALVAELSDGRSRVSKGVKRAGTNSTAPPPTQPEPYDDSVSIDQAQGVLAP